MTNANEYFDLWLKTQNQALEAMKENTERMTALFQGKAQTSDNPFEMWQKATMDAVYSGTNNEAIKETLAKTFNNTNAFQKLYDVWQPLIKAIQSKSVNQENYKDLVKPDAIKGMIDQLFNFDADYLMQLQKQLAETANFSGNAAKPWMDATFNNMQLFPKLADGQPDTLIKMFQNVYSAFNQSVGSNANMPAVGKDREKAELLGQCIQDLSGYAAKNAEMQHTLYLTGLNAMENVVKVLADKVENGEEEFKFEAFFDLCIDTNEKTYYALFQTQEYAKLKGDVLEAGLKARQGYTKLMESVLYDLPIALRSEMDDLYKTVYELRKKVKMLEKQIKEPKV
jgi:hypothetical protein